MRKNFRGPIWDTIAKELTMIDAKILVKALAKDYGCTLVFDPPMMADDPDQRYNHGAQAGKELFLSSFEDTDLMVAAFLHELGHVLNKSPRNLRLWQSPLAYELKCWDIARELAWKHRIVISDKAWAWGYIRALSYCYSHFNEHGDTVGSTRNRMFKKIDALDRFFRKSKFLKKA